MKFKNFLLLLIIFLVIINYIFHKEKFATSLKKTKILMDTVVTIEVFGENKKYLEEILDSAFSKIETLANTLNNYNSNSEIYKINLNAGIKPVKVSDTTITFLEKSIKLCEKTDGYIDITIGTILNLWGFATSHPTVPDNLTVRKAIKLKGVNHIKIYKKQHKVFIDQKGISIDVGAVAKGFIIDETAKFLEIKVKKAVINAGGDIKFIGYKDKNLMWKVGIRNPFSKNENDIIKIVEVGNWSIVTSGDYERFFIKNNKRYHHIINPFTGYPANNVHSVTVCTDSAFIADGLATAIFVMGVKNFQNKFLIKFKKLPHFKVVIIKSPDNIFEF